MRAWIGLGAVMAGLALLGGLGQPSSPTDRALMGLEPAPLVSPPSPQITRLRAQLAAERERWAERGGRYRREIRRLQRLLRPLLWPTPAGNRQLARTYFGDAAYPCASRIIDGETGGTWRHDVAYGFRYGEGLIYSGLAYGLGQARPGTKMLAYGADAASNPWTQLRWFGAYARARYGGVCAAAAHWTPTRSW